MAGEGERRDHGPDGRPDRKPRQSTLKFQSATHFYYFDAVFCPSDAYREAQPAPVATLDADRPPRQPLMKAIGVRAIDAGVRFIRSCYI
jgi:hypothetical protein